MKEMLETTTDWFYGGWESAATYGDDPRDRQYEFIVGPAPLPEVLYDEGGCD
jgi:hypothetical protein